MKIKVQRVTKKRLNIILNLLKKEIDFMFSAIKMKKDDKKDKMKGKKKKK